MNHFPNRNFKSCLVFGSYCSKKKSGCFNGLCCVCLSSFKHIAPKRLKVGHDRFPPQLEAIDAMQKVKRSSGMLKWQDPALLLSVGPHGNVREHIKVGANPPAHCERGAASNSIARLIVVIATVSLTRIVGKSLP
jgi:hypothetical protein